MAWGLVLDFALHVRLVVDLDLVDERKAKQGNDLTNFILMQAMGPNVAGVLYTLCR